ncbi:hypothetical protein [Planctomicrobium sp. SH527]|uniref:hypothetical protein n=1 Tax=Planctomicrobium sp. SH527 TaxID=3448123 RepID=UPI003F5BD6A4
MSEATDSEWFDAIDWTPLSDTTHWVAKCIKSRASLSTLLELFWRQVAPIERQVLEGEPVLPDVETLFAISDILAAWSVEINKAQGQGINSQPAMEFPFLARRLNGTIPGSTAKESALQAIDRLSALLRFLMLNFGETAPEEVEPDEDDKTTEKPATSESLRQHGRWTRSEPPLNSYIWRSQLHRPIIATQEEIRRAMEVDIKTMKRRAASGDMHVVASGKRGKENLLHCWFRDEDLHAEILDQVDRNRRQQDSKR